MNKKIYINPKQYNVIKESEWNFHYSHGKEHDMRPYGSDSKFHMAGRETGHFGSGTYFATYKGDNNLNQYRDDTKNFNPNFIQMSNGIYRVDLDIYKNLYRVWSKKQGDVLYTMLANLNHMANRIAYMGHFSKNIASYDNADVYQKIKANADGLGLKCPSYYELTRMAQKLGQDDNDVRSFSTVFMEWNGYNGVNVSGVDYYDNTKHGSVIYDLSKVNTDMEEVMPKSLYTGYKDYPYDDTVVQNGFDDPRIESLRGDRGLWVHKLNDMPLSQAMRLLKNYMDSGHIIDSFDVRSMNDELAKKYLRLLFVKNPCNYWTGNLCDDVVYGDESRLYTKLIEKLGAYYWINYESKKGSVLINLLNNFGMNLDWNLTTEQENAKKEEYLNMLMGYMQRELTDWEKEFINEDYYYKDD